MPKACALLQKNLIRCLSFSCIAACCLLLCSCSYGQQHWYKAGAYQADFDRDSRECTLLAKEMAREKMVNGKGENIEVLTKLYNQCLFDKGWSLAPVQSKNGLEAMDVVHPQLVQIEKKKMDFFGTSVRLPQEFVLQNKNATVYGSTVKETLLWADPHGICIHVVAQKALSLGFEQTPYPLAESFILFDEGGGDAGVPWRAFCGRSGGEWFGGVGCYLLLNSSERVVFTVTTALPRQRGAVPEGLSLDEDQFRYLEKFVSSWSGWLMDHFSETVNRPFSMWDKLGVKLF